MTVFDSILTAFRHEFSSLTSSPQQSPELEPLPPSRIVAIYGLPKCDESSLRSDLEAQLANRVPPPVRGSGGEDGGPHCHLETSSAMDSSLIECTQWLEDPPRLLIVFKELKRTNIYLVDMVVGAFLLLLSTYLNGLIALGFKLQYRNLWPLHRCSLTAREAAPAAVSARQPRDGVL